MNRLLILALAALPAFAAPTKVGNGDDGADLEGTEPIESGAIADARNAAAQLASRLHTEGVRGLGNLIPELKNTTLHMSKEAVKASLPEDQGAFHSDLSGQVYARTFARPYAATRFFPAAEKLNADQLTALHLHEALHRALPESVRENESIVAKITLAMTAPGATHDQVRETVEALVPAPTAVTGASDAPPKVDRPEPSQVGYQLRWFTGSKDTSSFPEIRRMHSIYSYLYPFGDDDAPLGLGIEATVVEQEGGMKSGPLGLSARYRVWSSRGFEVDFLGRVGLNTLSAKELVNSAFGRDIYTIGVSMKKNFGRAYIENTINYNFWGTSERTIGKITYEYSYGGVVNPAVKFGYQIGEIRFGGYAEIHLADHFRVSGGNFSYDTGRYRILACGPEIVWMPGHLIASVSGRFMLTSNKETDFSNLGDLMGIGVGQGGVDLALAYRF